MGKAFESQDQVGVVLWNPTGQPQSTKVTTAKGSFLAAYAPEVSGPVDRSAVIEPESIRLLVWKK